MDSKFSMSTHLINTLKTNGSDLAFDTHLIVKSSGNSANYIIDVELVARSVRRRIECRTRRYRQWKMMREKWFKTSFACALDGMRMMDLAIFSLHPLVRPFFNYLFLAFDLCSMCPKVNTASLSMEWAREKNRDKTICFQLKIRSIYQTIV